MKEHSLSERKACRMIKMSRTVFQYRQDKEKDAQVIAELNRLAGRHPGYDFGKMRDRLKMEGFCWNHKKVYRVYTMLKMNLRRKHKRRLPSREAVPIRIPEKPNCIWSMDYMTDTLYSGRKIRILNIIDDYNRQALAQEVDFSLPATRVIHLLEHLILIHGKPFCIRTDNGPEFISHTLMNWCHKNRIQMQFIQPGKPMQNGLIERFNGSYRKEILDAYVFYTLQEIKIITEKWMEEYNNYRPHQSLNGLTPIQYLLQNNNQIKITHTNQITNFELAL